VGFFLDAVRAEQRAGTDARQQDGARQDSHDLVTSILDAQGGHIRCLKRKQRYSVPEILKRRLASVRPCAAARPRPGLTIKFAALQIADFAARRSVTDAYLELFKMVSGARPGTAGAARPKLRGTGPVP